MFTTPYIKNVRTSKFLLSGLLIIANLLPFQTFAQTRPTPSDADFAITSDYTIEYTPGTDYIEITETLIINAYNPQYFFPAKEEQVFIIPDFVLNPDPDERDFKKSSIRVFDRFGNQKTFTTSETDKGIEVHTPDNQTISYSSPFEMSMTYRTHELLDKNGNIINLYIPGLPEDVAFSETDPEFGLTTEYVYSASLVVPNSSPEASYLNPSSIKTAINGDKRIYSLNQSERRGKTAWIQLGTDQYYYFKLVQPTTKTDTIIPEQLNKYTDLLSTNIFRLPLPKEDPETNQRVFFKSITPEPVSIERDQEGNLTAIFEVPANKESEIVIEGYVILETDSDIKSIPNPKLSEYLEIISQEPSLNRYLKPDQYWETDSETVQDIATTLEKDKATILELVEANYNYLIDRFEYDYTKLEAGNPRLGAHTALNQNSGVCMEYSDSMIALLRSQGVPARAVVGYGNDPTGAENQIGTDQAESQNIGHQWLQVWIPEYGWLSVDPTWGESGREYIGGNLDHFLWYTLGASSDTQLGTSLDSADLTAGLGLQGYEVYLQALESKDYPGDQNLMSLTQYVEQFEGAEYDKISLFLKTNLLGKALVLLAPICGMFLMVILGVSLISKIVRRKRGNKNYSQPGSLPPKSGLSASQG